MYILHLVLYSTSTFDGNECYESMRETLCKYYKKFDKNVKTIFYKYTKHMTSEWLLEDDILHIRGSETFIPGILEKTLIAFSIFKNEKFDYLVRSNVSTIINFDLLIPELMQNPISFYGGGRVENLQWTGGGITDKTWYGTNFVCGTGIILTKDAVNFILDNEHNIRKTIIDDVAIGILMREYRPDVKPQEINPIHYHFVPSFFVNNEIDIDAITKFVKENKIIFYRNRCYNCRKVDEIQEQVITNILINLY